MLDIKKIKENPDAVKAGLRAKEVDCDATVDRILELDAKIRTLKTNTETQTAQKNKLAKENGKAGLYLADLIDASVAREAVKTLDPPPRRLRQPPEATG